MIGSDTTRALKGGVLIFACIGAFRFWAPEPVAKAFLVFCAMLGLFLFARGTANLLAARYPPPPPKPAVREPVWEDYFEPDEDDSEEPS